LCLEALHHLLVRQPRHPLRCLFQCRQLLSLELHQLLRPEQPYLLQRCSLQQDLLVRSSPVELSSPLELSLPVELLSPAELSLPVELSSPVVVCKLSPVELSSPVVVCKLSPVELSSPVVVCKLSPVELE
jgi:hypothetical protein